MKKFFWLKLSVSALETLSYESSIPYEDYYDLKNTLPAPAPKEDFTVVGFDGKGVPMIKKEAATIKARRKEAKKERVISRR